MCGVHKNNTIHWRCNINTFVTQLPRGFVYIFAPFPAYFRCRLTGTRGCPPCNRRSSPDANWLSINPHRTHSQNNWVYLFLRGIPVANTGPFSSECENSQCKAGYTKGYCAPTDIYITGINAGNVRVCRGTKYLLCCNFTFLMWCDGAVYYRNVDISDRPIIGLVKKRCRYSTFIQFLPFNSLSVLNNLGREVKSTLNLFLNAFLTVFLINDHQYHPWGKKTPHTSVDPSLIWYTWRFDCIRVLQRCNITTFLFWQVTAIEMSPLLHHDCCSLHADSV